MARAGWQAMLRNDECWLVHGVVLLAAALTVSCVEAAPFEMPAELGAAGQAGAGLTVEDPFASVDSSGGAPSSAGLPGAAGSPPVDDAPSSAGAPSTGGQVAAGGLIPIGVTDPTGAAGAPPTPATGGTNPTNSALPECGEVVQWVAATNPPTPLETGDLVYYEDTVYEYMGDPQMYHFNVDCPPVGAQSWCAPQGHFYRPLSPEDECRVGTIIQP